jgi:large repetitive protein
VSTHAPSSDVTTAQGSITVQGQVVDSLTASTAAITIDGITKALPLDSSGAFSTTAAFPAEGMHTILVTATNQAGVSTSAQRNVQYTMFGDLNGSGSVDLADAVLAFRQVTGEQQITDPVVQKRCDVAPLGTDGKPHPDGVIDLGDVVIIMRKAVGLVTW